MIRIIHAADLHLDSPFESLGAEKASVRRSEQRALLERITAEVNKRNADLLLLAGDLLDSDGNEISSMRCNVQFLEEAKEKGACFVAWFNK